MKFPQFRKNIIPRGEEGRLLKERFKNENVCKNCGQCCYQGFMVCGCYIMAPELPCKYLVRSDNGRQVCGIYEKRHELSWCNTVNVSTVRKGLFPADCVYVQGMINYHGKSLIPKEREERIRKALLRRLKFMSCPEYLRKEDWRRFIIGLSKNEKGKKG